MYIKRLKYFWETRWGAYFAQYPKIKNRTDKELVKKILTSWKKNIEENEYILTVYWIVNWIWPWYIGAIFRAIITFLFGSVSYFWHDIEYWIFWTRQDKINADNWLLKYSILWFYNNLILLSRMSLNLLFKILFIMLYIPVWFIQLLIVIFCWAMVRIFWNSAFSFIKRENA